MRSDGAPNKRQIISICCSSVLPGRRGVCSHNSAKIHPTALWKGTVISQHTRNVRGISLPHVQCGRVSVIAQQQLRCPVPFVHLISVKATMISWDTTNQSVTTLGVYAHNSSENDLASPKSASLRVPSAFSRRFESFRSLSARGGLDVAVRDTVRR